MENSHIDLRMLMLIVLRAAASSARAALPIGEDRQVFLDDRFIEEARGVELAVHRPHKTGQIVLKCEHPWQESLGQYHSLLYESGVYRMWYTVHGKADSNAVTVRSIA